MKPNIEQEQANGFKAYLRRHEAAQYLACSVRQLDELKHDGEIPHIYLGRRLIVFKIKDLDDFMDRHRIAVGESNKGA